MRVIIAGSRSINDYPLLERTIKRSGFDVTEVVSGGAYGVDHLGERYAFENNLPLHTFTAEWDKYGKSAGYRRNIQMSENADALIALWDGNSKGTRHMIDTAYEKGLKVYVVRLV